tara:strand:- start:1572 stop:1961 length:390 start_codon:yes stop_codon:yes gene_type:complete
MKWEDILKAEFRFSDIQFKKHKSGEGVAFGKEFNNGLHISIIAGTGISYSEPRSEIEDPMGYKQYEMQLITPLSKTDDEKIILSLGGGRDGIFGNKTKEQLEDIVNKALKLVNKEKEKESRSASSFQFA